MRLTLALVIAVAIAAAVFVVARERAVRRAGVGAVTLVGDSLNVGTEPYLRDELDGWTDRRARSVGRADGGGDRGAPQSRAHARAGRRRQPRHERRRRLGGGRSASSSTPALEHRRADPLPRLGDDRARRRAPGGLQRRARRRRVDARQPPARRLGADARRATTRRSSQATASTGSPDGYARRADETARARCGRAPR